MNAAFLSDLRWAFAQFNRHESHRVSRQLRFILRSVLTARASQAWFGMLREFGLPDWTPTPSEWLQQPHRPFFDHRLGVADVAHLLLHDLRVTMRLFGPQRLSELVQGTDWELARVQGRNATWRICLRKEMRFSKEGTLSLCLLREDGAVLKRLVFCFAPDEGGGHHLRIGCVQSIAEDTLEALRAATKDLHGIQPRLLLVQALRVLAQHLECSGMQAISVDHHVYRAGRYRSRDKALPGYDDLWLMAGGTQRADGNYDLPLEVPRKALEDVASNKRAEYRRRYEMADALVAQMRQALGLPAAQA